MTEQMIFYGAGARAAEILAADPLRNGVCFADADTSKQGGIYLGLPVLSPEDALAKYELADIY
ncbi:MAG: hypothetical protein LBS84_09730 [Clostridiales bacterium]|jgi:hypothetical protein|nr:hypothetical protein [Clostridiales bacterium]